MKYFWLLIIVVLASACRQENDRMQNMQNQIDSLQTNAYRPGFGEFMSNIQVHHEKLWFAGTNQNWALAAFEINEIRESLDGIKKFCTDRPETRSIDMIAQPLTNLSHAIQDKDLAKFKNGYTILTATCNSCHEATNHGFNVIIIPTAVPFTNQDFKLQNEK